MRDSSWALVSLFFKEFLACCGVAGLKQRLTPPSPTWALTWDLSASHHVSCLPGELCKHQAVGFLPLWVASDNSSPSFPNVSPWALSRFKGDTLRAAAVQTLALASPIISVGGLLP